ncbi:MAG: lipase maturation factor family protein, partial [Elusimicrobia bacterium]|nr:lipase maturation factor family protein [Elusimicrobiota bacterium]
SEPGTWRWRLRWGAVLLLMGLSVPPVLNMLSPRQEMNASFDPIGLVNTYGAFGSVGKERDEVVLEGTRDALPTQAAHWSEYELPCAPGDVLRRPCWASPYHYRLDWQMWFLPFSDYAHNPWLVHLAAKLLRDDPVTLGLFAGNPFPGAPPRWVRGVLYRYRFTRRGEKGWWVREPLGPYLPPVSLESAGLRRFLAAYGWKP